MTVPTRPERERAPAHPAADTGRGRAPRRTLVGFGAAAVALVLVPVVLSRLVDQPEGMTYRFEIPAGTAALVDAGHRVDVFPSDLQLALRDRLVVVNRDDRVHAVGPFTIRPGETLDRRFSQAVSLTGFCSLHPDGTFTLEVRPGD